MIKHNELLFDHTENKGVYISVYIYSKPIVFYTHTVYTFIMLILWVGGGHKKVFPYIIIKWMIPKYPWDKIISYWSYSQIFISIYMNDVWTDRNSETPKLCTQSKILNKF